MSKILERGMVKDVLLVMKKLSMMLTLTASGYLLIDLKRCANEADFVARDAKRLKLSLDLVYRKT
jgi:hypothetical protein